MVIVTCSKRARRTVSIDILIKPTVAMISTKSEVDDDEQWVCKNRMNLRRTRFQFDTEMGKDWFVIGMLHSAHRFVSGAFDR